MFDMVLNTHLNYLRQYTNLNKKKLKKAILDDLIFRDAVDISHFIHFVRKKISTLLKTSWFSLKVRIPQ